MKVKLILIQFVSMLDSQTATNKTLWEQMQQVRQLQDKTIKYLNLCQKIVPQDNQTNQFLDQQQETNQPFQQLFQSKASCDDGLQYRFCQKKSGNQSPLMIAQSHYIGQQQDIRLSRIFEEIHLGQQIITHNYTNTIEIQFWIQSELIHLHLSRPDIYNLSNFSSFNNNKSKEEEAQFEFKDLLEQIQQQTNRILSPRGITKILMQMQHIIDCLNQIRKEDKEIINLDQQKTIKNTLIESVLTHNNQSDSMIHKYDVQLNNQIFKKAKPTKSYNEQPVKAKYNPLRKSIINGFQTEGQQEKKDQKTNIPFKNPARKRQEDKQNLSEFVLKPKTEMVSIKQLKIMRRNNHKCGLVMLYNSLRDIDNFCIVNKLSNKDKEKITKAAQTGKTLLNLE